MRLFLLIILFFFTNFLIGQESFSIKIMGIDSGLPSDLVYQITGNNPVVNYDFNTVGTFDVSLRVRDNDNVWSTYQYETIIVQ